MTAEVAIEQAMDLREYWQVIARSKYIVAGATVLVVGIALFVSLLQPTTYSGEIRMAVEPRAITILTGGTGELAKGGTGDVGTEVLVLQSQAMQNAVADKLGYVADVTFSAEGAGNIIDISSSGSDRARVAREVQTYLDVYIASRVENVTQIAEAKHARLTQQIAGVEAELADPSISDAVRAAYAIKLVDLRDDVSEVNAELANPRPGANRL